jgi:molybdate transport system regulatory protein
MPEPPDSASTTRLSPRLRVHRGGEIALGPGKVALLEAIAAHGTLADGARSLGMSYMRAWKLVQTMNACFRKPLVVTARGGTQKGQAALTAEGREALRLYREMEEESLRAAAPAWEALRALLG